MLHHSTGRLAVLTAAIWIAFASPARAQHVDAFTEPYRQIDAAAAEMGRLGEVLVREGERVSAGQILASLDDDALEASLELAEAASRTRGRLEAALAELRMQSQRLEQLEELWDRQHAHATEVQRARSQREVAAAQVLAAREELQLKTLEVARIGALLERRRVRSPIDGVVDRVLKDPGEFVSAGDSTVVRVVQLDPLLAVFSCPAIEALKLRAEDTVRIEVGDSSPADAVVELVGPTADPQSGTVRVKVRLPNARGRWRAGQPCRLLLSADESLEPTASPSGAAPSLAE